MNTDQKLENFTEKAFSQIFDRLILPDGAGYMLYGEYSVQPQHHGYVVTSRNYRPEWFASKRSAISYCVADHYRQYKLAANIKILDQKKHQLVNDIECSRQIAKKSRNGNFSESVLAKTQPKQRQLAAVNSELEKCLYSAKYMQIRGFSNETARSVRSV